MLAARCLNLAGSLAMMSISSPILPIAAALRSDGRHGKDRGEPPAHPIQHDMAVTLVCGLVLAWLRHVGAPNDPHTGDIELKSP